MFLNTLPKYDPSAGLPSERERLQMSIQGVVRAHTFPVEHAKKMLCPEEIYSKISEKWAVLGGEVWDKRVRIHHRAKKAGGVGGGWEVRKWIHETPHGDLEIFCRWDVEAGAVIFGFYLIAPGHPDNEESDEEDTLLGVDFECLGTLTEKEYMDQKEFLDRIWNPPKPPPKVLPLVGEKKISGNEKCFCGSGKKFRRCCGR
jgi:hypothetical protein